jgi:hypothetical protein
VLARLDGLVRRAQPANGRGLSASWPASSGSSLPQSSISSTALVALAMNRSAGASPQLAPALRSLRLAWGVEGWPTGFDSARAAAALLTEPGAATASTARLSLRLNGLSLHEETRPFSETLRFRLEGNGLRADNTLELTPADSASLPGLLLAYRRPTPAASSASDMRLGPDAAMLVRQDYLDPRSGAPLDPATLRLGQLVRVRLTLVALQPLVLAELHAALPAGLAPVDISPTAPFLASATDETRQRVVFQATSLAPGVHSQTYLARAVAAGSYNAPAPRLSAPLSPEIEASGNSGQVVVSR